MTGDAVGRWLAALEARHLRDLTFAEVRRALQALSATYVQQRGRLPGGAALEGAGKRAAFALFYGPLHFLAVREVVRAHLATVQGQIRDLRALAGQLETVLQRMRTLSRRRAGGPCRCLDLDAAASRQRVSENEGRLGEDADGPGIRLPRERLEDAPRQPALPLDALVRAVTELRSSDGTRPPPRSLPSSASNTATAWRLA